MINEINNDTFNIKTIIYAYMIFFNIYIFIFNYHINDIKKSLVKKIIVMVFYTFINQLNKIENKAIRIN